jgi:hypothetical protein
MLENDLQAMFEWQASSDQPPAEISFPAARRRAQVHRRRRRVAAIGSPIVAAAAAVAIGLSLSVVSGVAGTKPASTRPRVAPTRFNPLVPYASFGWLPGAPWQIDGSAYPTVLFLMANQVTHGTEETLPSPQLVVYPARGCALTATRLACGSASNYTSEIASVSGRGPIINGHASYWAQVVQHQVDWFLLPSTLIDGRAGPVRVLAFQSRRGVWALLDYPDRPTAIRIAQHVRFAQETHVRFPMQLTGLPRQWNTIQQVNYSPAGGSLLSGGALILAPRLEIQPDGAYYDHTLTVYQAGAGSPRYTCQPDGANGTSTCTVIDGDKVELTQLFSGGNQLTAGDADGLDIQLNVAGPDPAPSAAEVFAHHLKLLGPNPANWTTMPIAP